MNTFFSLWNGPVRRSGNEIEQCGTLGSDSERKRRGNEKDGRLGVIYRELVRIRAAIERNAKDLAQKGEQRND